MMIRKRGRREGEGEREGEDEERGISYEMLFSEKVGGQETAENANVCFKDRDVFVFSKTSVLNNPFDLFFKFGEVANDSEHIKRVYEG